MHPSSTSRGSLELCDRRCICFSVGRIGVTETAGHNPNKAMPRRRRAIHTTTRNLEVDRRHPAQRPKVPPLGAERNPGTQTTSMIDSSTTAAVRSRCPVPPFALVSCSNFTTGVDESEVLGIRVDPDALRVKPARGVSAPSFSSEQRDHRRHHDRAHHHRVDEQSDADREADPTEVRDRRTEECEQRAASLPTGDPSTSAGLRG
jgi:hypothetical protein